MNPSPHASRFVSGLPFRGNPVLSIAARGRLLKKTVTIFLFAPTLLFAQSVNLPLWHWAYPFFDRMETRGLLFDVRSGSRPFTRQKAAKLVLRLDKARSANPAAFSRVESQYIERLKGEFYDELHDSAVTIRHSEREPHLYSYEKEGDALHADAVVGGKVTLRSKDAEPSERRVIGPYYGVLLRGSVSGIGAYSDNRIFAEWGTRKYIQEYRASRGYPRNAEKDSSRATWDMSDSYLVFPLKGFSIEFGRDNLQWGRSFVAGLFLSGLAPSMDMLKFSAALGGAEFSWAYAELRSDFQRKWLSAHRLEFSAARGVDIGLNEAVVYGNRGLEAAYANPIMPYLVAQHSLGNRDNLVMGFDASIRRIKNLRLYGEAFIDDLFAPWDIFDDYWGNRLAFMLGGHWVDPLGLGNTDVRMEYVRIEPFVYSHDDSVNVFEH
ncbi:MAG TPA: capsule assembly Wzi family protein, partial [bacterium]